MTEKMPCYFCKKKLEVNHISKEICVDGSTWFKTMPWPVPGDGYTLVEGYDCTPVAVCSACKSKIKVGKYRAKPYLRPGTQVKII